MTYRLFISEDRASPHPPSGFETLIAFSLYLGMQLIVMPLLAAIFLMMDGKDNELIQPLRGWFIVLGMLMSMLVLVLYGWRTEGRSSTRIFEQIPLTALERIVEMSIGAVSWFVAFPLVIFVKEFVHWLLSFVVVIPPADQIAVSLLRTAQEYHGLFVCTIIAIIFFAPIAEELLFRGFLQNWLRHRTSRLAAAGYTSLLFMGFHYSSRQGWTNPELLIALFLLSLLLSLLYERKRALWAPMTLHATFNAMSVWFL